MSRLNDILCDWQERAAIAEHDGGLSRDEAERLATERCALEHGPATAKAVSALAKADDIRRRAA